jgi:kynureninase
LRAAVAEIAPDLPCVSPEDPVPRGSHLSFRHPNAYAIAQALIARGVIPDFRDPDILRLGLAPAYLRFEDCWHAAQTLGMVLANEEWQDPEFGERAAVT